MNPTDHPSRETDALANMLAADSRRIDALVDDVGEVKGNVHAMRGDVGRVSDGVDELRSAMAVLVRHEMRMDSINSHLGDMRAVVTGTEKRVSLIELSMPLLLESRGIFMKGMVGLAAMVGLALIGLVLKVNGGL